MSQDDDPRVQEALDQLESAQGMLNTAAETLSPVLGYAEQWDGLVELYHQVRAHWHQIDGRRAELKRSRLVLGDDGGGPRYFLAGRPVRAGAILEFDSEDEGWQSARFEWSHDLDEVPELYLKSGAVIPLPEQTLFRWAE